MAQAAQKQQGKSQGIEYTIYTFDQSAGGKSANKWQKRDTKSEMSAAITVAEDLFKTGKFKKVEIKQKYFDKKKNRDIDMTLKVYEGRGPISVTMIFMVAVLCGVLAFVGTYFFAK